MVLRSIYIFIAFFTFVQVSSAIASSLEAKNQQSFYHEIETQLVEIQRGVTKPSSSVFQELFSMLEESDSFEQSDEYDFEVLYELYDVELDKFNRSKFNSDYFVSLSYLTWNYDLELKDSSGNVTSLNSKERGPCLGGGYRKMNALWGIESSLCYAYLTATVGEDSNSIKFIQSDIPVDALMSMTSLIWRPKDRVFVKFGIPLLFKRGDYNAPSGGRIDGEESFSFGYQFSGEWSFENISFAITLGSLNEYPSSFWGLDLRTYF